MPQTTKLIWQQLEHKRQLRQERANRLKLRLVFITVAVVLIIMPLLLLGGAFGAALLSSVRSIPDYVSAEAGFTAQNQPRPIPIFGRNASGEPVELYTVTQPAADNGRWVSPSELSPTTLSLVYAQWPGVFLNNDLTDPGILARWVETSNRPVDIHSPAYSAAVFVNGGPLTGTVFGRLQADLLKSQIQTNWTPEELATWHLNSSYYGNQVFGIQSAARFYFGRDAAQLTLPEAAMLIGVPKNPKVNPIDDPAGAKLRQEVMLEALLRSDFITQEQFIAARFTPLDVKGASFSQMEDVILERFVNSRLGEIRSPAEIADINVITTINPQLQQDTHCLTDFYLNYLNGQGLTGDGACAEAVNLAGSGFFPTGQFNQVDSVLAMVLDPTTGQILALSGAGEVAKKPSGDPNQPGGWREAGGMFYPFVYLTALSQGHTLSSMVLDIVVDEESETPTGAGPIFLEEALISRSPAAVEHVLGWMGLGSAFKTVSEMGAIPSDKTTAGYQPGKSDVSFRFIELAHAYGVLANSGVRVGNQPFGRTQQSIIIRQIENSRGDISYEANESIERAILPSELTWLANQKLANVTLENGQTVARVTASGDRRFDEWTIGYSSNLLVAVWAGNLKSNGEGGSGQQPVTVALWERLMVKAAENRPLGGWPPPDNIVSLDVCWPSGLQPNGLCPTRQGLFVVGTEPILFDTMYQSYLVNSENRNLATSSTPPNRIVPITVQVFPKEAQNWAVANGYELPPAAYDSIRTERSTAGFQVESPAPFDVVTQQTTIKINFNELGKFKYFRVAAYVGLSPGALQILADEVEPSRNLKSLDILISLPYQKDGLYTLLVTGFRPDGSIEELAIPVNADVVRPIVRLTHPLNGTIIPAGEAMLFAQIEGADEDDIERVEYYLNGSSRPIVTSTTTPFTGGIPLGDLLADEVDCFSVRAVALDYQGNQAEDSVDNICFDS